MAPAYRGAKLEVVLVTADVECRMRVYGLAGAARSVAWQFLRGGCGGGLVCGAPEFAPGVYCVAEVLLGGLTSDAIAMYAGACEPLPPGVRGGVMNWACFGVSFTRMGYLGDSCCGLVALLGAWMFPELWR